MEANVMSVRFTVSPCVLLDPGGAGGAIVTRSSSFPPWWRRRCGKAPTPPVPPSVSNRRLFSLNSEFRQLYGGPPL